MKIGSPLKSTTRARRSVLTAGAALVLSGCGATSYYLTNVYRDNADLYVQRCPVYASGKYGDSSQLSTRDCLIDKVQEMPPDVRAAMKAQPPPASPH